MTNTEFRTGLGTKCSLGCDRNRIRKLDYSTTHTHKSEVARICLFKTNRRSGFTESGRQAGRQADTQANTQPDRQAGRQTGRRLRWLVFRVKTTIKAEGRGCVRIAFAKFLVEERGGSMVEEERVERSGWIVNN